MDFYLLKKQICYQFLFFKKKIAKKSTKYFFYFVIISIIILLISCASKDSKYNLISPNLENSNSSIKIKYLWKATIGKTGTYLFQPTIINSMLYSASIDGSVAKFSIKDGHIIWRTKLNTLLSSGISGNNCILAVGGINSKLIILDKNNGKQLWHSNLLSSILSLPLVSEKLVIVCTVDGCITAFNSKTGQQYWRIYNYNIPPIYLRTIKGMVFALDTMIIAGFPNGVLVAINIENGQILWKTFTSSKNGFTEIEQMRDIVGIPGLTNKITCVVTYQDQLSCFNIKNGKQLWAQPFYGYTGLTMNEQIIVAIDNKSVICAYETISGKVKWQNNKISRCCLSQPAIIQNTIVIGDQNGFINFISIENGSLITRIKIDDSAIFARPLIVNKTLIIQTATGTIYAFRLL